MINLKIESIVCTLLQARLPHGSFRLPHVVIPVPVPAPGFPKLIIVSDDFGNKFHRKEVKSKLESLKKKTKNPHEKRKVSMFFSIIASDVS